MFFFWSCLQVERWYSHEQNTRDLGDTEWVFLKVEPKRFLISTCKKLMYNESRPGKVNIWEVIRPYLYFYSDIKKSVTTYFALGCAGAMYQVSGWLTKLWKSFELRRFGWSSGIFHRSENFQKSPKSKDEVQKQKHCLKIWIKEEIKNDNRVSENVVRIAISPHSPQHDQLEVWPNELCCPTRAHLFSVSGRNSLIFTE